LCWFCMTTSNKFQLSITLGKQLHLYEVVLQNGGSKKMQHCGTPTSDFK
jgi:hypothetical protein